MRRVSALGSCAALTLALAVSASAQSLLDDASACLDALPPRVFTRFPVYLVALADSAHRGVLRSADMLALVVGERMRAMLGGSANQIPAADSIYNWRRPNSGVIVTANRDGRFVWARRPDPSDSSRADDLLVHALAAASDAGERVFWPEGLTADSATFTLSFQRPSMRMDGSIEPVVARNPVTVFSALVPWEEPVRQIRAPRVRYPLAPRSGNAIGRIILKFVVDTLGRAEMNTAQDDWPADKPRLTGDVGDYYRDFLVAVKRSLRDARYEPARIGGCVVRQLVTQQFEFSLFR